MAEARDPWPSIGTLSRKRQRHRGLLERPGTYAPNMARESVGAARSHNLDLRQAAHLAGVERLAAVLRLQ